MRHYNKIDVRRDKKFRLKQQEKQKQINQQQIIKGTKSSSDNVLFSKSEQVENTKEKSIFSRIKEKVSNILDY
jgi:hypothetical protein